MTTIGKVVTLSSLLADRARTIPGRTCLKYEGTELSYRDLDHHVTLVAGGLRGMGLNGSERVAILMENRPEYIMAYFAILRAGCVAVPVNHFLTPDEIAYILKDCSCSLLIFSRRFEEQAQKVKESFPSLQAVLFEEITEKAEDLEPHNAAETAVLLYTSGTTGFPKGAMLSHGNLLSNVEACQEVMRISRRDRILLFLPLFHAFAFTVCVLLPIYAGARIILLQSVKPFSRIVKSVFRDRVTFFIAVPTVYSILARKQVPFYAKLLMRLFLNVRACVSGAAALPQSVIEPFEKTFRVPLIEGYGLTEASPVVAVNPLYGKRKPSSVGLPLPGVEVAVFGDDGSRCSPEKVGELAVKGPNVMKGYYNRDEETAAVVKEGWLYTGDLARIDDEGYIFIVDRKKDLIIMGGMNIYPREVEDLLMTLDAIEECAMVGVPDGRGSEISKLFVKRKEGAVIEEGDLRNFMKGRLATFKIPRRIVFVDEFEKTATGKIKKDVLRRQEG